MYSFQPPNLKGNSFGTPCDTGCISEDITQIIGLAALIVGLPTGFKIQREESFDEVRGVYSQARCSLVTWTILIVGACYG